MEKAQDIPTNPVKNTIRKKVWRGFFWGLFFFSFEKKYLFTCDKSFPDGSNLQVWRNHLEVEGPFLPNPLHELVPALTNAGPAREGSVLGKCRPRISCGLPALPFRFWHREDGRVLTDPVDALPPAAVCRASKESHKSDICPSKPSPRFQKQNGIIHGAVLLSWWCTHTTEEVNIYTYIYTHTHILNTHWVVSHSLHGMQTVWNKHPWLQV